MVLSFFRNSPQGLEHIQAQAIEMLADARQSFDLATRALLSGTPAGETALQIRKIDNRINQTEQNLRAELVIHATVHNTADIASVLGLILLLKKIERIGDQAKNIVDLAELGVSLSADDDGADLFAEQLQISSLFTAAAELLADFVAEPAEQFFELTTNLENDHQAKIEGYVHSTAPAYEAVPKAIYYRYLKRIVANLRGIVGVARDPLPHMDYLHDGAIDTDD